MKKATKKSLINIIGKKVIVRANVAGVHAGIVEAYDGQNTIQLKDAARLWRIFTRDPSGSISDVAANGLKEGEQHIGAILPGVVINNPQGLEIAFMTDAAYDSVIARAHRV